jgi:hypothetical protein
LDLESLLPTRRLELRVSGASDRFSSAVQQQLSYTSISLDDGWFRLELAADDRPGEVLARLLQLARETGATVEAVNSTGRRLEDAYLKLITEDEVHGFLRAAKS